MSLSWASMNETVHTPSAVMAMSVRMLLAVAVPLNRRRGATAAFCAAAGTGLLSREHAANSSTAANATPIFMAYSDRSASMGFSREARRAG